MKRIRHSYVLYQARLIQRTEHQTAWTVLLSAPDTYVEIYSRCKYHYDNITVTFQMCLVLLELQVRPHQLDIQDLAPVWPHDEDFGDRQV